MLVSRAAWFGLCLLVLGSPPAQADESSATNLPPVVVLGCPDEWSTELRDLLALELQTLIQERRDIEHTRFGRVAVECRAGQVRIDVELASGERSQRWVATEGIEREARARTVALTATELVDALWLEREPPPTPPRIERPQPTRRAQRQLRPSVHVAGSLRRTGRPGVWLFGGLIGAELPVTRALAPVADLRLHVGRRSTDLATVDVFSCSAASHLLVGSHAGVWRWGAGPGVRLGWVSLRGDPESGTDLRGERLGGLWGGPGILGRVTLAPGAGQLLLTLSLDGGLVTLPVTGTLDSGTAVFAMDGGWLGAALGVGMEP